MNTNSREILGDVLILYSNLCLISVDCQWNKPLKCNKRCGPGKTLRTIKVEALNGGKPCLGNHTLDCNNKCPGTYCL